MCCRKRMARAQNPQTDFALQLSPAKLEHLRVQNVKQAVLCAAFHLRQTSRGGIYRIV